jgi:excisionase family DNA binding protein
VSLITVQEAAQRLNVTHQAVYFAISEGKLTRYEQYGRVLLDEEEVANYKPIAGPERPPKNRPRKTAGGARHEPTRPRIVSKSRYLRYLSQKAALDGAGTLLFVFGIVGAAACVVLLFIDVWWSLGEPVDDDPRGLVGLPVCLLAGGLFVLMAQSGFRQMKKAERLEPLVPLTRQTADQLPAEQSLVRASSEPSEQQAVLLRAAAGSPETAPEQLLRATMQKETMPGRPGDAPV